MALLFFYCFTGCDTVSSLSGKVKCKAWDTWLNTEKKDEFTTVFKELGHQPKDVTTEQMQIIEEFVCLLYGVPQASLASIRLNKFQKSTDDDLRKLPPSREALSQHVKDHATKLVIYDRKVFWIYPFQNPQNGDGNTMK